MGGIKIIHIDKYKMFILKKYFENMHFFSV